MRVRPRTRTFVVTLLGLLPAFGLAVSTVRGSLGANPIETLTHETGIWALRFLLLSLAVSPLRRWLAWSSIAAQRRTLGLLAFAYASAHLLIYAAVDQFLDWGAIVEDVLERPYITVGFSAFLCLVPLALTSTRRSIRRLGRRWWALHRLVYPAAGFAGVHFLWGVKADRAEPLAYLAVLAVLFAARLRPARARTPGALPSAPGRSPAREGCPASVQRLPPS
ncbi:MAG: sulfite oxidase heme-binding subunit YedZ [Myxococcota bacterium]